MPAKVTLSVTAGQLKGQQFVFDERTACLLGKVEGCHPRLPHDADHKTVSRHHCLFDINPPDIRVRDFGSLNGTWVNGQMIGRREKGMTPDQASQMSLPEHDLKDGDEVRLGKTVFRVSVFLPTYCSDCSAEIPKELKARAERSPDVFRCEACRKNTTLTEQPVAKNYKVCAKCGRDVSAELGNGRQGELVCAACRNNPLGIIHKLLELANRGQKNLIAIQGYTILKELGRGGMGAVYLARHDQTGEQVALKVMLPRVATNQKAKQTFLREAENTQALRHPNVVEVRDVGCVQGTFFFTLGFCDGGSVDQLMKQRGGPLSIDEAVEMTLQALDGLEYAHHAELPQVRLDDGTFGRGEGLVHRDLKPHNIFLSGTGRSRRAMIGDFGLAKAFDLAGLSGQTCTGAMAGTPVFMPRPQIINFKYAKPDVDVWAMAATLYFMLTGQFTRDFPRGKEPFNIILSTAAVPIRKRDSSIPSKLAEVIDTALIDQPSITFKSAADFKRAIEKVV